MKPRVLTLTASLLSQLALSASGATHYVSLNNRTPAWPYTTWDSAATNIQDAVDAAVAGEEIIVANGLYATGGRAVYGTMTNRVAIEKAVTVRSFKGPLVTIIEGWAVPGTTNGEGAIRCAYVGDNAVLSGFTLTNGHTRTTGADIEEHNGGGVWCKGSGVVSNCVLSSNSASYDGGGAYSGTLNNCTLVRNWSSAGGAARSGTLNNCTITGNWASFDGGGAYQAVLNNCTLEKNAASRKGGGATYCVLNNCILSENSACWTGGGAQECNLNNCAVSGNSASLGGGAYSGTMNNCIVYYNDALDGSNYYSGAFNYSCTTPLPPGPGNIDSEPLLASSSHLSAQSPCIGRGSTLYTSGVDMDGENWLNPPCIGADQFVAGYSTGKLTTAVAAAYTNVCTGFVVPLLAQINGRTTVSLWDFGDGVVVSNRPYVSHAWAVPGTYQLRLIGYNESWPDGVSATQWVQVLAREVYYVNATNAAPVYPYTSWAGAAVSIQAGIDAGKQTGRLVLVADGVYRTGGRAVYGWITNRVGVPDGVEVRSVNGPLTTRIEGGALLRCAYVGNKARLSGFTLTNGHTLTGFSMEGSGGGAWCEVSGVISNCALSGNQAFWCGGGAYGGTLDECTLSGNSVQYYGGGAFAGMLRNCTLDGNSAYYYGGGASQCTLENCRLSGNSATGWDPQARRSVGTGGGAYSSTLNECSLKSNVAGSYGGGAAECTLNNSTVIGNWGGTPGTCGGGASTCTLNGCTICGNWAYGQGGGVWYGTLNNCIVYYNSAPLGGNYHASTLNNSCTSPLPASGSGNIISEPLFVDTNGWSNLRLQFNSPCINSGGNAYAAGLADLDRQPRVSGGTVDIGAYEFQSPASIISYNWLTQYGLPTDGSADYIDLDHDGLNNWQEWVTGTSPVDPGSALRILSVTAAPNGWTVRWQSVSGISYFLERSTNLAVSPGFSVIQSNIIGQGDATSYGDTTTPGSGPWFYRVGVAPR